LSWCRGCGGDEGPGRFGISGKVLAEDDAPLANGVVTFIPLSPTPGPRITARVQQGEFAIDEDDGPCAGQFRVEVTITSPDVLALQEARRVQDISPVEWAAHREIDAAFNRQSTLTASVGEGHTNEFAFRVRHQPNTKR
jgi:hypothetical protein